MTTNVISLVSIGAHPTSGRPRRAEQDARAVELGLQLAGENLQVLHAGNIAEPTLRSYLGMGLPQLHVLEQPRGCRCLAGTQRLSARGRRPGGAHRQPGGNRRRLGHAAVPAGRAIGLAAGGRVGSGGVHRRRRCSCAASLAAWAAAALEGALAVFGDCWITPRPSLGRAPMARHSAVSWQPMRLKLKPMSYSQARCCNRPSLVPNASR